MCRLASQRRLLLGVFHGVPTTKKSIFNLPLGPDHIVLYQKNIEAVCSSEPEVREQGSRLRLTSLFGQLVSRTATRKSVSSNKSDMVLGWG
jgi:hypothetical protein